MMYIIAYAIHVYYEDKTAWRKLIRHAMNTDVSWDLSATKYKEIYNSL